jgi:hypothetical protein
VILTGGVFSYDPAMAAKQVRTLSAAEAAYIAGLIDRQIEPYLRSYKRERARLSLAYYVHVTPRNGKYSNAKALERAEFEDKLLSIVHRAPIDWKAMERGLEYTSFR